MAIPVQHTIRWEQMHNHPADPDLYRNIGAPPKFHVVCSCQWEGWAHTEQRRDFFIESHRQAQIIRGNAVTVVLVPNAVVSTPEAEQPFVADVPSEGVPSVESTQLAQFHPDEKHIPHVQATATPERTTKDFTPVDELASALKGLSSNGVEGEIKKGMLDGTV